MGLQIFRANYSVKKGQLDWKHRYHIIGWIAREILYLHQDSRLTIIHCDLKVSNINVLDADMNPRIADLGMARIFVVDSSGYMSPEYAMHGQFSVKSDVYSFGVLILEIISSRKNISFFETDDDAQDSVTHMLWNKGTASDLVDPVIVDRCQKSEVVRCIHIGLLCVQENPVERPALSTISVMLTSNTVTLPVPQQPGFFMQSRQDQLESDQSTKNVSVLAVSIDDRSISDLHPR